MMTMATRFPRPLLFLLAVAFAATACDDGVTDPVGSPSDVQVRAYVDLDGSGTFTQGDHAVEGATVTLTPSAGGTAMTATTGPEGLATFSTVEPGTYTLSMDMAGAPEGTDLVSPSTPTVVAPFDGGQVTAEFRFVYLFGTIATAKQRADGDPVFLRGVVTVEQGAFRAAGDNLYFQDASGGIQVFGVDPSLELQRGADVMLRGERGSFSGEVQIVSPEVTVIGTGTVPTPRQVTGSQIVARTYEGDLVVTRMARLVSVPGGTAAAYNLTFTAEDGTNFAVRIEAPVGATVTRATWEVGAGYDLTGVPGAFNSAAQLKPRGSGDIVRVADPIEDEDPDPITLAEARLLDNGTLVSVIGVVTVGHGMHRTQGDNIYIQDATAGLQVFGSALNARELAVGDSVLIVGVMATFNDERQVTDPSVIEVLGSGTVPAPLVLGSGAFNALDHEGELVRIENVTLVSVGTADGVGRHNVVFGDAEGTMEVRIEQGVVALFPAESWEVGATYTITGALGQFRGLAQLKPRMEADVVKH
jgi:DNA/RNA endonuclease YhcR with UshA esterase domain